MSLGFLSKRIRALGGFYYHWPILIGAILGFQNCGLGFEAQKSSSELSSFSKLQCTTDMLPSYRPSALTKEEVTYVIEDLFSSEVMNSSALKQILSQFPEFQVDRLADLSIYKENNRGLGDGDLYLSQMVELSEEVYKYWSQQGSFSSQCGSSNEALRCFDFTINMIERLWRRPLIEQEFDLFLNIFSKSVSLTEKVKLALMSAMNSPQFYLKNYASFQGTNRIINFSSYEMASRFSFFLFNSAPDQVLWDDLNDGKIRTESDLLPHVDRLLGQERYLVRFMNHVITPWLGMSQDITNTEVIKNPEGKQIAVKDLAQSQYLSFKELVKNNWRISDFFYGGKMYLNDDLANYLQLGKAPGSGKNFIPVEVGTEKGISPGFFASAYFAYKTRHSEKNETRVSKRGIFLSEKFLCDEIPVNEVSPEDVVKVLGPDAHKLNQIQVGEIRRKHPSCMSCHQEVDKHGIGFESLSPFGRIRTSYDSGTPIEFSLPMSESDAQPVTTFNDFLRSLSQNAKLHKCFIRHLANKFAPLNATLEQPCSQNSITLDSNLGVRDQIKGIVTSHLFSKARKAK